MFLVLRYQFTKYIYIYMYGKTEECMINIYFDEYAVLWFCILYPILHAFTAFSNLPFL